MTRLRVRKVTSRSASGATVVRNQLVAAPELEWKLQAAAVRRLRARPEYGVRFTLAADFNAGRRGPQEATKAKATGLTPGEPDLRIYADRGRLLMIEMKAAKGRLSKGQVARHALLKGLGYRIEVVKAAAEKEAADLVDLVVLDWLTADAANDNQPRRAA